MAKKKNNQSTEELWYYDACALDAEKDVYGDILGKRPIKAVASHLSLGEAYGNCCIKSKEAVDSFLELITGLIEMKKLIIVGNDSIDGIMEEIKTTAQKISPTDLMHISTAIHHKCCVFVTVDGDFCGWSSGKKKAISEIAKSKAQIEKFCIRKV